MSKTYFALQDNQLENGEIVVTLVDNNGRTVKAKVSSFEEIEKKFDYKFAETSKYYGQLMNDCHIFNPYLHRRFLPSVFTKRIMDWNPNCHKFVFHLLYNPDIKYCVDCIINDVEALIKLYHTQDEAYEIRSKLLPIERLNNIIAEFRMIVRSNSTKVYTTYPSALKELNELKGMRLNRNVTVHTSTYFHRYYAENGLYWTIYNMVAFGKRDVAKEILNTTNPIGYINEYLVPCGMFYDEVLIHNDTRMEQIKDGFCKAYSKVEA